MGQKSSAIRPLSFFVSPFLCLGLAEMLLDLNIVFNELTYIYKTNRGWLTRLCIHASGQPNINLSAGPVGPHEG